MVAVVGLAGELGEVDGQEGVYLDALFAHALEEGGGHLPAAYVVEDDAHADALAGTVDEGVGHEVAQRVVLEDVDVDVYVVTGGGNVAEQAVNEGVAVGVDADVVDAEGQRGVLVGKELDELFVAVVNLNVGLVDEAEHGAP